MYNQMIERILAENDSHTPIQFQCDAGPSEMARQNRILLWQFDPDVIDSYNCDGLLLTMDFDFGSKCSLNCCYCFVCGDYREQESISSSPTRPTTLKDLKRVFDEAVDLGLQSAKLVGAGEPFETPQIIELLEYISQKGVWVTVFTHGRVLGCDEEAFRYLGMSSEEVVLRLKELRVSIMLKMHSLNPEIEDRLVGARPGKPYSIFRNRALELLLKHGFNHGVPTRLGIENVIIRDAIEYIEQIYMLKIKYNMYVDIDPPVPIGRTGSNKLREPLDISLDDKLSLCTKLYEINKRYGIPFIGASPFFGGEPCSQLPNGLYINYWGRVYPCCGAFQLEYLGNIYSDSLRTLLERNPYRRHWKEYGTAYSGSPFSGAYHGCPYREETGILPRGWENEVNRRLELALQEVKIFE